MFDTFFDRLEVLRQQTARFRRVALHIHSPDSRDWGKGASDTERNAKERFQNEDGVDLYLAELSPHLELAGITDHMRCTFATQLGTKALSRDDISILPGMEVNISLERPLNFARIHVLAILPAAAGTEDFACLFNGLDGIPRNDGERSGNEEVRGLALKEWVARVHGEGGICIAAHVENQQGIRYLFRQTARDTLQLFGDDPRGAERENNVPESLKEYLFESGIDALEVQKSGDEKHYRWVSKQDGKSRSIPTLLTFDAHCCEQFTRADRITHIKMTSPDLTGLRNAFAFPDTRIRFPKDLPDVPATRILGISITGNEDSFFEDVHVALAENLNCLIGTRGSGKSTVVETLRYVFGYNRTLDDLGREMANGIRDRQKANLSGSMVKVAYRLKSGEERVLQATFDDKDDYVTKVFTRAGEHIDVSDVEASGDYPVRLFGWSEIETLGRDPAKQRDLLDRLIPELADAQARRNNLRGELRRNKAEVENCVAEVRAAFGRNDQEITRYREYKADFEKLNTEDVRELFSELDLAKDKSRVLERIGRNAEVVAERLDGLTPVSLREELDAILEKGHEGLNDWWLKDELQGLGVVAAETDIEKKLKEATERVRAFSELASGHANDVRTHVSQVESDLQAKLDESGDDSMQRIADLRENAGRRLRQVSELRAAYMKAWDSLTAALGVRSELCKQLTNVQNEVAGIRIRHNERIEGTLNHFLPDWMKVSIDFVGGGDKTTFASKLIDVVPGRSNSHRVRRTRAILQQHCTPVSCAETILDGDFSVLIDKECSHDGEVEKFTQDDVDEWMGNSSVFDRHDQADVPTLVDSGRQLQVLLDLQETEWDDFEAILLDGDPVNAKSPGQRSSAMLPLIALAEDTPLIIDQPEDNLDKRLIGSVLMNVLAELKEKRQITVCTHDPNILVGGDAEQVIVLEAESNRKGKVVEHGSIDNEKIVGTVIDLLEGGEAAFETRQRRYGLDGEK